MPRESEPRRIGTLHRVIAAVTIATTSAVGFEAATNRTANAEENTQKHHQQIDSGNGGYFGKDGGDFPIWTLVSLAAGSAILVAGGVVARKFSGHEEEPPEPEDER